MKKLRRIFAVLLSVTLVMVSVSSAFAWGRNGNNNGNKPGQSTSGTYNHMSIAVYTENSDENGGYYLASKPTVTVGSQQISLGSKQSSQNNGYEYQSGMGYKFTADTVFDVKAVLTNGTDTIDVEFTITNVDNYKNSGMSFYEYCAANWCDSDQGIDMKLTYEDIVEHFYDVKYDVDGDYTVVIDSTDYKSGDTVTVSDVIPEKEGCEFVGWQYDDEMYHLWRIWFWQHRRESLS